MKIDLDGWTFDLLKSEVDWTDWQTGIYECSKPNVYPCLALNISDSEGYDTQIYLPLSDLEAAVNLLKEVG